jgi:hypothetical protein
VQTRTELFDRLAQIVGVLFDQAYEVARVGGSFSPASPSTGGFPSFFGVIFEDLSPFRVKALS